MMIWHVAHGSTNARKLLRLGLRNIMYSAWSYQFAKFGPMQIGTIRASGGRIFVDSGALSALKTKPATLDWLDKASSIGLEGLLAWRCRIMVGRVVGPPVSFPVRAIEEVVPMLAFRHQVSGQRIRDEPNRLPA